MEYHGMEYNEKSRENLNVFKNSTELTEEQKQRQREISIKGGKARAEQRRKQKTLKETVLTLLNSGITRELAEKYLQDNAKLIDDENLNMQTLISLRLITALLDDGNAKAYELLRDTSGQSPKQEIQVSADIMTNADRDLLAKVNARLNKDTE